MFLVKGETCSQDSVSICIHHFSPTGWRYLSQWRGKLHVHVFLWMVKLQVSWGNFLFYCSLCWLLILISQLNHNHLVSLATTWLVYYQQEQVDNRVNAPHLTALSFTLFPPLFIFLSSYSFLLGSYNGLRVAPLFAVVSDNVLASKLSLSSSPSVQHLSIQQPKKVRIFSVILLVI